MKIDLQDYITTFAAFNPEYDATSTEIDQIKARTCYQKTKEFIGSLAPYMRQYPELKIIKEQLSDLNELFADLAITRDKLSLYDGINPTVAQSRVNYGHILAKEIIIKEEKYDEFIEKLKQFIKEINNLTKKQGPQLNEKKKLNEVDTSLLANSMRELDLQERFFGGGVDINAQTYRAPSALFANGDLNDLISKPVKIEGQASLMAAANMLQRFIERVESCSTKFGIDEENTKLGFTN